MEDTAKDYSGLALILDSRLQDWDKSRNPQELKMIECYQDVMRIPREDDTKGSGASKANKTKGLFIGSTRNKVRSSRAKINDALFGNGKLPFDTEPLNEGLSDYADVMEDILTEQLIKMDMRSVIKTGVNYLCMYGTGFLFGIFVKKDKHKETYADNSLGFTRIVEQEYEYDCPYFEMADTLDVYPDPEARKLGAGLGVFWVTMESPHTVKAWQGQEGYFNIDLATQSASEKVNETGSEKAASIRANVEYWHKNDRIKVARYFGKVPAKYLSENESGEPLDNESDELLDAVVVMAGGHVVKISESPYQDKPAYRCAYEEVENSMWAVGVAENNMPHQKTVNAAFRLFMEGKGMALLGTKSVDRSMFMPTEDFRKYPGKVYHFKAGLSPEERKSAVIEHIEPDITNGWLDVIKVSEQFSDDDTAITKYTQGDDSSNLNKTATGISMIMNASSLPLKEVIQHIDNNWIEPMIEDLIEWNIKYLEVETVRKLHGDEKAQKWQEIKEFGKSSFMNWKATGTSSFMQKEILTNKIRAFSEFALSNPALAQLIDARELLEQTWDSMEVGKESPILKDENDQEIPPQIKQKMEGMQQALQAASEHIAQMNKEKESKEQELSLKSEESEKKYNVDSFDAETRRLAVIKDAITPEMIQTIVIQTIQDMINTPPINQELTEQVEEPYHEQEYEPTEQPEGSPPDGMQQQEEQPPQGGFLLPEETQPDQPMGDE